MMTVLNQERGSMILSSLYCVLILCTALMVVNSYLQYRCERAVGMHRALVAANLAESGVAVLRRDIDRGAARPGQRPVLLALGGGTLSATVDARGQDTVLSSTGTYMGVTRTVHVTGRLQNGRFIPRRWW